LPCAFRSSTAPSWAEHRRAIVGWAKSPAMKPRFCDAPGRFCPRGRLPQLGPRGNGARAGAPDRNL
jgi:hypothetical protein